MGQCNITILESLTVRKLHVGTMPLTVDDADVLNGLVLHCTPNEGHMHTYMGFTVLLAVLWQLYRAPRADYLMAILISSIWASFLGPPDVLLGSARLCGAPSSPLK